MKKVLINSDVINSNDRIFFNIPGNSFEWRSFEIGDDLIKSICAAHDRIEQETGKPSTVIMIPFAEYNKFVLLKKTNFPEFEFDCLCEMLNSVYGFKYVITVLIPDYLKEICKPT